MVKWLTLVGAGLFSSAVLLLCVASVADASTQTFNYTGGTTINWTVPAGVTSITINALGAQGGTGAGDAGGKGGSATGTLSVSQGTTYYIVVGGQSTSTAGGLPGGGNAGDAAGGDDCNSGQTCGGGGYTGFFSSATLTQANAILIAGGGGGSSGCTANSNGHGGALTGGTGQNCGGGNGGTGGSQSSGGTAGTGNEASGTGGSALQGGNGGTGGGSLPYLRSGAGGGGGYYGGGGAGSSNNSGGGTGGGGSAFMSSLLAATSTASGVNATSGVLTITDNAVQIPTIASTTQYKSDGTTPINEGSSTTESIVFFKAFLNSSSSNALQLQIQISTTSSFTNVFTATSTSVSPATYATTTSPTLADASYYWRGRALDTVTNATSSWQQFGTDNVLDFVVNTATTTLAEISDGSVKALYHLEDAIDSSGNGYDLTNNGSTGFNTGKLHNAADFGSNNSTKYLQIGDNLSITSGAMSMSAWVKFNTIASGDQEVVSVVDGGTQVAYGIEYTGSINTLYCERNRWNSVNQVASWTNGGSGLSTDTWYHIVCTYDGSDLRLYVNNDLKAGPTAASGVGSSGAYTGTGVGAHGGYPSGGGYGKISALIDEVVITNSALSTDKISDLYNNGNGREVCVTAGCGGTPASYYAQIQNAITLNLRQDPSTSSTILKTLPADWTVYVSSTVSATGTTVISNGYKWFDVIDKTDGVEGWMAASSSGETYLSYVTSTSQADFEGMASTTFSASSTRAEKIVDAVNWYWDHISSTDSLYNTGFSYLFSATSSASSTWIFPKELFYAMASREDGGGFAFNNQQISFDYGHGIMQLTPYQVWSHEPSNWASNTEDVPMYGSHIVIPPCAMIATDTYTNCYTYAGTHNSTGTKTYKDYGYSNASTTYKFYANKSQSIYANIKDGLNILKNKYTHKASSTVTASSTVFQPYEREWLRATWGYNGLDLDSTYLSDVAAKMDTFSDYYSSTGTRMVATSTFTVDLANKLRIANDYKEEAVVFSPVEVSITDSADRTTGMVNGVIKEEIPDSAYNSERKAVAVFFSNDTYTYTIKGIGNGTYGLLIDHPENGSKVDIYAPAIPVKIGEVHTYTVDWDAVAKGNKGVTVEIDSNGDDIIDKEVVTDKFLADLTLFTAPVPTENENIAPLAENTQALCSDGLDNDYDGAIDLTDFDCKAFVLPPPPIYVPPIQQATTTQVVADFTTSTKAITSPIMSNSLSTINSNSSLQ